MSQFDDGFHGLDRSYPDPFPSQQRQNPRETYGTAPAPTRFKVIDDSFDGGNYIDNMKRNQMPTYHTLPNPNTAHYTQPYQHTLKRPSNADRMKEIFGDNQNYESFDEVDFKRPHREEYGVNPMDMRAAPQQRREPQSRPEYIPRMKYIEADNPNPPIKENYHHQGGPVAGILPDHRKIYNAILEAFPDFIMTKTAVFGRFSVYKAVANCMLCNGTRFVIAIVKDDTSNIRSKKPLAILPWKSFQTRWVDSDEEQKEFQLNSHTYSKPDRTLLDDVIRLSRTTTSSNLYDCDNLPLSVEVIRTREDEDIADVGTVFGALELFQTVLSFSDED